MMTIVAALVIVAFCIILLGVRIFFVKGGKFPDTSISGNKYLRSRGIHCAHEKAK